MNNELENIEWGDFTKIEMRVGTVLEAEVFEKARRPAYILMVDFGEYGIRKTSAQITKLYQTEELIGKQVVAVVNFPEKQIANIMSQCLVLGAVGENGEVTLLEPNKEVKNGMRIG